MIRMARIIGIPAFGLATLAACETAPQAGGEATFAPEYLGTQTRLLEGDLVSFLVAMKGARDKEDVARYGECVAAQYALIRGYGFARHVRTEVEKRNGVWYGDAGYVISASIPDGVRTIDAEITVQNCITNAIPTV